MKYDLIKMIEIVNDIARKSGACIMDIYNSDQIDIQTKNDLSPLTLADTESDKIINELLTKNYPEIAILSEEKTDDLSRLNIPYCFIVDPLDGTKEFINKNGEFTVNIALSFNNKTILGVVYVPFTQELYFACQGEGAYKIDHNGLKTKLQVTSSTTDLILASSRSHKSEKISLLQEKYSIKEIKEAGSSLKGCLVASGEADIYYRFGPTMEWDTAAMQCIIEEAGGIFKQMDGSPMTYNRKNSLNEKGFFAVNRKENIFNITAVRKFTINTLPLSRF